MSGPAALPSWTPRIALALCALLVPVQAWSHSAPGMHVDALQGFAHAFAGQDHLLVMVGVGFFAAGLGARARWALPTTFLIAMALSALATLSGVLGGHPAEHLLALSVLAIGVPIALALKPALPTAMALVAVCAALHGQAHAAELPAAAGVAPYLVGLLLATALLHASGALAAIGLDRIRVAGYSPTRSVGAAMVLAGLVLACA